MKTKQAENGASLEIRSLLKGQLLSMKVKTNITTSFAKYELASLVKGQLLSYLVGLYILTFYLELYVRKPYLQSVRFQFSLGALIGLICAFKYFTSTTDRAVKSSLTKTAFLLIFVLGFYTIFSYDRSTSLLIFNDRVLKFSLLAFFIYVATDTIHDLRVILALTVLAWLKLGQEGFQGWLTGGLVWYNQGIPRLHGATPMFGHPNSYGGFAVSCLPFCIFLFKAHSSKLYRLSLAALLIFSLTIIMTTGSRTGYVALVLATALFLYKSYRNVILSIVTLALMASLVTPFIPESYQERFVSIITLEEKEGSSSKARLQIINDAIDVLGVQAFPAVRDNMFGRRQDTHNLYLEVLTNIGPLGFIVFILFIYRMIKTNLASIESIRRLKGLYEPDLTFLLAVPFAVIGFVFIRLVLGLFGMDLYEIYWWLSLGLTLATLKLIRLHSKSGAYNADTYNGSQSKS
jgi:putative inorganic carbon (hco3(-)) transporter